MKPCQTGSRRKAIQFLPYLGLRLPQFSSEKLARLKKRRRTSPGCIPQKSSRPTSTVKEIPLRLAHNSVQSGTTSTYFNNRQAVQTPAKAPLK